MTNMPRVNKKLSCKNSRKKFWNPRDSGRVCWTSSHRNQVVVILCFCIELEVFFNLSPLSWGKQHLRIKLSFFGGCSLCVQLLLKLEEQLFFLGFPPLYQAFTNINAFVEQPIWTHALWNGPWLAEKSPSLSSFSKAWIQSQGEVQKSSVLSDRLNCNMLKGYYGISAKWHQK